MTPQCRAALRGFLCHAENYTETLEKPQKFFGDFSKNIPKTAVLQGVCKDKYGILYGKR